jgi:hypothetical protein
MLVIDGPAGPRIRESKFDEVAMSVVCPQCESEYLPTEELCADCGVALVRPEDLSATGPSEMPSVSDLTCIRAASVSWVRSLSQRLSEANIRHRIEAIADDGEEGDGSIGRRPNHRMPYGAYVHAGDVEAALVVDQAFMRTQIPDLPEGHETSGGAADAESCPACGERVGLETRECPECGLALAFDE